MNNDLISRSALLAELSKGTIITDDLYGMGIMAGNEHAMKKIKDAPTVDAGPKWISVEERLPDEDDLMNNGEFIVMIKGAVNATTLLFDGGEWTDEAGTPYPVTHWMPLPEPPGEQKPKYTITAATITMDEPIRFEDLGQEEHQ